MSIRNQKDTLAKLMATENITVVHKKVPTAVFDVKNRILTCPILKENISADLYDLFMGHEVGHALYTPLEGLHSAVSENRTLKGYLNVIEDVRIERKIRDKFNGLRKSFYNAYNELMEIDFFGVKDLVLADLSLIDRINLHTKCGSRLNVSFTEEEQVFVDRSFLTETWDDVVALAKEIYEFSKDNEVRTDMDDLVTPQSIFDDFDDFEDEDGDETDDFDSMMGEGDSDDTNDDYIQDILDEFDELFGDSDASDSETGEDGEEDEEGEPAQNYQGGEESSTETAREAMTEWNAHDNEELFLSEENQLNFVSDLTEFYKENNYLRDQIVSYKDVQQMVSTWVDESINNYHGKDTVALSKWTAKKLVEKNKKIVNHMAKEFEMRQSAHVSLHARTGKTGKLDPNKLASYQVVDDVFKRTMMLPKGKNHGINLMLDWSGSISRQVPDLLEQALVLVMFCQKVQIPFRVYLFTSQYTDKRNSYSDGYLVELFSNEMRAKEYKYAVEVVSMLWNAFFIRENSWGGKKKYFDSWYDGFRQGRYLNVDIPWQLGLGGTPLDSTLFAMRTALKDFNERYKVEKSILTILTDGYSHDCQLLEMNWDERHEYYDSPRGIKVNRTIIDPYSRNAYTIRMPSFYRDNGKFNVTQSLIDWVAKECNATVTGFFILSKKNDFLNLKSILFNKDYRIVDTIKTNAEWSEMRKTGLVLNNIKGYNKLILSVNTKAIEDDGLDETLTGEKKGKLLTAFRKNQKGKMTSRFIANEFMKEIA